MSTDTKELIQICQQLPEDKREEVADFARFLLARNVDAAPQREALERWLVDARGVAKAGMTTDEVMALTRGEP